MPQPFCSALRSRALLGLAALLTAVGAQAADVGVSVSVSDPGFWGRVDIGTAPPPLIYRQPVIIAPAVSSQPIYVRVPPGQEKKWARYCARYGACNRPVYFVRADAPPQTWHRHGGPRGDHHDDRGPRAPGQAHRDDGPGKGHGHGHGRGQGHGHGHGRGHN